MGVAVVRVRVVWVPMSQPDVFVQMGMRLTGRVVRRMIVPVVLIVPVPVLMLHLGMEMLMRVALGQMQPEASAHQRAREQQFGR